MARKKAEIVEEKPDTGALPGAMDVSAEEVLTRTAFAKMRALELSVRKEELALLDKAGELCKIDVALSAFDNFLKDYVTLLRNIPDKVQSIIPQTTPDQYRDLRNIIEDSLQRMAAVRLHLTIESTVEQRHAASEAVEESRRNATKKRKEAANAAE